MSAAGAYLTGVVLGIPAFLVIAKLFIWTVTVLNHFLGALI